MRRRHDDALEVPQISRPEIDRLICRYQNLELVRGSILRCVTECGDPLIFVECRACPSAQVPDCLPSICYQETTYFLVPESRLPADFERKCCKQSLGAEIIANGDIHTPKARAWPTAEQVSDIIKSYRYKVMEEVSRENAIRLLADERKSTADLYASSARITDDTPMLVEGLMRERGVSIVFGDFDEFKTTLVLDLMAHVATGTSWQGRSVKPFPVVWYALEGVEEIPVRLRALEQKLKRMNSPWGDDGIPLTVLDRIPSDPIEWRYQIEGIRERWNRVLDAREELGELPTKTLQDREGEEFAMPIYRSLVDENAKCVVVIDTLSMALGGEDEKGAGSVEFIQRCLDLLKTRDDLLSSDQDAPTWPVATHVIVIHHQTKTGQDFAGHRAIGANTQGLYRVHRSGSMADLKRPYSGQFTPLRVKGISRPSPIRFDVEVVKVADTRQTAAILRDGTASIPPELEPIVVALVKAGGTKRLDNATLNSCLDKVARNRTSRARYKNRLIDAGILEQIDVADGKGSSYRLSSATGAHL